MSAGFPVSGNRSRVSIGYKPPMQKADEATIEEELVRKWGYSRRSSVGRPDGVNDGHHQCRNSPSTYRTDSESTRCSKVVKNVRIETPGEERLSHIPYPQCLRPAGVRSVRLTTGLVVFTYVGTHLRNHAWLHNFRRLRIRFERRADIHEAFLKLGCSLVCWNIFRRTEQSF